MQLKEGESVWLKSGGPEMTVKGENIANYDNDVSKVVCSWFVKTEVKEHDFVEAQLTTEDPN